MEKIYSCFDIITINLYKSLLESENIPCIIRNEFPPAAGEVPAAQAYPELWLINSEDKIQAKKLSININTLKPRIITKAGNVQIAKR
ncbi:putative signal transducing protein [Piscirickettsia litoralis]|uniref:DUF2007 domain-containing protein n=1 Tax=Piscirickettsia litoralis TaxID=1891921 RepID=A0ABX3A5A0_9GAMM|nr:DUF2007 domain-containing protein [Piscirickettsia litoralis]ODN42846.1 hypothetical protein BGC07_07820 [Piscirickettsia litoralis]